jgi:hypothetical protein
VSSVLEATRTAVSLVPERFVVEAARDEAIRLDELEPTPADGETVLAEVGLARRVLANAIERWRQLAPRWSRLNFAMQHQAQSEWCWAATSVSVSAYYDPGSGWTQCTMVNAEMGLATCCEDGSSEACNTPNVLDRPLQRADVLDHKQVGSVGYDVVKQEIDAGRPICWRIGWNGGGGHFAVIEGYQDVGDEWLAVDDPWWGSSDVAPSTLIGGTYQGSGSWTHTYFTRPQVVQPRLLNEIRLPREIWERMVAEESRLVHEGSG